jgi:general secretion pathway protein B
MSILMAALKQQNQSAAATPEAGANWRKLALLLALLLAMLSGAIAAYLLMPLSRPAAPLPADEVQPAGPAAILAALNTLERQEVAEAANAKLAAGLADAIAVTPAATPVIEEFDTLPAVKTLTAGTAAAEPQPQAAVPPPTTATEASAEVSAELRDKFASALKATETTSNNSGTPRNTAAPAPDITSLDVQLQRRIPPLRFEAHVYATAASQRWVKVNGKTLQEGQWVTADIRIKEITPQYVLLEWGSQLFSMPALSAWPD